MMWLLKRYANWRLQRRHIAMVAAVKRLHLRNRALLDANANLSRQIVRQADAEKTLRRLVERHEVVGAERLARIAELEGLLLGADADNAQLSGRLSDAEEAANG